MKLFYAPGACSMGIHLILEEIGKPFEAVKISLRDGPEARAALDAVNPKGKVPTLQRDDGMVITEYPVIAAALARANPEAKLLPADPDQAIIAGEAIDYCVATIHMQGFSRLFRPANFAPSEADHEAVKARGRELMEKGFAVMAATLGDKDWIAGSYSIADSALFYVEYWAAKRMGMTLPAPLAAHLDRMLARPAVQRMLAAEGLAA
ncbi:MAG: glutathione S-transferase family protein [Janthinobacterium lividum]